MKKELTAVKNKIKKLRDKKALIDEELKNNITITDLMAKVKKEQTETKKEKTDENSYEK